MAESWYVIRTRSQAEFKAAEQVHELGLEVYCPRHLKRITKRGKRVQRRLALIPSYAFVRVELNPVFARAILDCRDVLDFLDEAGGDRPQAVPDVTMRSLRDAEADTNREQRFGPGDVIMIVDGLRAGNRATILRLDGSGKLKVQEIDSGTVRPYSISRTAVEPAAGVTSSGTRTGSIECAAYAA